TGQTTYVEPKIIQDLNEELHRAHQDEIQEIERILKSLTRLILRHQEKVITNYLKVKDLDFLYGTSEIPFRLHYCLDLNESDDSSEINQIINPLVSILQNVSCVPNNVSFETNSINIISGPNAGG